MPEPSAAAPKTEDVRPCCACPETRSARDECIFKLGEESCREFIEKHNECLRAHGFIL